MSNAILTLVEKAQRKLERQLENIETTKVEIEVLGDTVARQSKLKRQNDAVKETRAEIKKLNDAAGKLK